MDLFNRGAAIVTIITAIVMVLCHQQGFSYDSAVMHLTMGATMFPIALLLERNSMAPRFIFAPVWAISFIPLASGAYRLSGIPLTLVILIIAGAVVHAVLADSKKEKIYESLEVTHELLDGDPDKLRSEIEENRAHHHTPPGKEHR